ncbi:MAG: tetratricopeptide repeat protein [Synechococcaceae cyanobacterium]
MSQPRAGAPSPRRGRSRRRRQLVSPLALALASGLGVALSQHQARAFASAPQPPQGFDLWVLLTALIQRHGQAGFLALGALALAWGVLSQAQNIESARRQLGWMGKPEDPSPTPPHRTHGPLSPTGAAATHNANSHGSVGDEHAPTDLPLSSQPDPPATYTPHNLPQASDSAVPLVGRDAALIRLSQLLEAGKAPVWITGMDGVGKTALAVHHLRQRLAHYGGGVVMLDGPCPLAGLVEQLERFALVHFDQQVPEELAPEGRLAWLYSHWRLPGPVLLLLDELRDPADLQALGRGLPERFRLLVTSRRQYGTASQRVPLEPLEESQGVDLLAAVSERGPFPDGEKRSARAVTREVGGLPLALWLLGRRLARDGDLELAELERRLREKGALARDVQASPAEPLQPRGLCASFQLAWEGMDETERQLALLLGDLPPTAIPWELLAPCAPPALDADDWREARLGLEKQHLITRPLAGLVGCHPLLHDLFAAQAHAGARPERRLRLVEALRHWLSGISDVLEARSLARQQRCLPLLESLSQWPLEGWPGAAAGLPHLARGRLLSGLGADGPAEEALRTALGLARQSGGAGWAGLEAGCLVALAGLARERGQWQEAEGQCRQALAVLEAAGAGDDLGRAEALNGLGLTLAVQAKPEAETVLREALVLRLQHLDGADRLVQISRNNLAMSLRRLGRAAEAEALYRQVLAALHGDRFEETTLEQAPCEVSVTARHNLSFLAEDADQLERAHGLRKQAVALAAVALGEDHPRRGLMLMSLGVVAEKLGRLAEAERHFRQAVQLTATAWGPDHPRSQDCRLTLEAFLAAPFVATAPPPDPALSPEREPTAGQPSHPADADH